MYCMGISLVSKRGDKSTVKFLHLNFLANSAPPTSETKDLGSDIVTPKSLSVDRETSGTFESAIQISSPRIAHLSKRFPGYIFSAHHQMVGQCKERPRSEISKRLP